METESKSNKHPTPAAALIPTSIKGRGRNNSSRKRCR